MNNIIVASTKRNIVLGYEGENAVTQIIFVYDDSWLTYGEGEFKIRVLRNGDKYAYNAELVNDDRENRTLTMTVTDTELAVKGNGEMQLCYFVGEAIKKSCIYSFKVLRSIDTGVIETPPPIQNQYVTREEINNMNDKMDKILNTLAEFMK